MPNMHRLLDGAAVAVGAPGHGAEMAATGPQFISLPGYLEIFTGHPDPLCGSNACGRPPAWTIADEVFDASGPDDVAIVTSWPNIARAASADPNRFVLTTGRTRVGASDALLADDELASLLDAGERARPWPGEGDYRPDATTARIALRLLETSRPRFLFVGLGDADEYAHRNEYRNYLEAVHASDAFLGQLSALLERMGARGRHTTVLVTADHGRAHDFRDHGWRHPESGRVWLLAAGDDVRGRGIAAASQRYTLSNVAPTVRSLLGMAGGGEPIAEVVAR
jgi:arylsulfatase A-like enzyme